jgi:two-component system response regulator PilR (NtrC family)/two-component system KDP operon response regulator KdpE
MIVDDEADICYLLGCMLRENHYVTHAVRTLTAAIATLADYAPCLIFLDVHLPDGSGLRLVERAKNLFPPPVIILMSAYDCAAGREETPGSGADFFLAKPFTHDQVRGVLSRFLPPV